MVKQVMDIAKNGERRGHYIIDNREGVVEYVPVAAFYEKIFANKCKKAFRKAYDNTLKEFRPAFPKMGKFSLELPPVPFLQYATLFRGMSRCNLDAGDIFDENFGKELAKARALAKLHDGECQRFLTALQIMEIRRVALFSLSLEILGNTDPADYVESLLERQAATNNQSAKNGR